MSNRIQNIIKTENRIKDLEKKIKIFEYIIMFLIITIAILIFLLIGNYIGIWGGAMIPDENLGLGIINFIKLK